ncbi:MAG: hypothetical protein AB8B86_19220 [Pseudomonadales bacterium]
MLAQDLSKIIQKTRYTRNYLDAGYCIHQISELVGVDSDTLLEWMDRYAEPSNSHELLIQSGIFNSVVPVYAFPPLSHSEPERVETVATGVLVRVNSSLFLLTAYHALPKEDSDRGYSLGIRMNDGGIFSLTGQGLGVERGHYSGTKKDTLDFAFYDLSKMDQSPLSKTCVAIEPKDVDLTEKNSYGRVLTHIGYPLEGQDNPLQPGALSLTGYEDSIIPIRNFSYKESVNICMRFSRKSATLKTADQHRMPHPKGMSGGAIFSWSDSYGDRQAGKGLKLAGIFHAWEGKIHTFCGTRMSFILGILANQRPELFREAS